MLLQYASFFLLLFFFTEFHDLILVDNIQHREFEILFGVLRYITVIIIIMFRQHSQSTAFY